MSEFSKFEPSAWIEDDGVCLVPLRARASSGVKRLVKDVLLKASTTTAALCIASSFAVMRAEIGEPTSDFAFTRPSSRAFGSSEGGDIDPRIWGNVITRLKSMRVVETERDFDNEPEPFI